MTPRASLVAAAAAGALATALVGGIAWAAIPAVPGGVIQGCYDNGGSVKVVETLPCPRNYTPFQWNQQGIQGPKGDKGDPGANGADGKDGQNGEDGAPGPRGADGAPGPPGAPGQNGVSGYEVVSTTQTFAPGAQGLVTATCPSGKAILQGSLAAADNVDTILFDRYVVTGFPQIPQSYSLFVSNGSPIEVSATARASCISVQ